MHLQRILDILEKHEIVTAISIIAAFYIAPIVVKIVFSIVASIIAFFLKAFFNDALEVKIRNWSSTLLTNMLHGQKVEAQDLPHIESEYVYLYRLVLPITDHLTVFIPTLRIRMRIWRLVRKALLLYIQNITNSLAFRGYLRSLCADEVREITLQNVSVHWKCPTHNHSEECHCDSSLDIAQLKELSNALKAYRFHILWDRADLNIEIDDENFNIENIGGYIHNKYGAYKIFLHGLYDGQIMTLSNEGTDISYYQLNVPALNLNPILWDFLADTFPNLLQYKIEKSHHLNRMHNIHCRLHLKNSLELIALTGSFESPYTPFVNVKNLNHH